MHDSYVRQRKQRKHEISSDFMYFFHQRSMTLVGLDFGVRGNCLLSIFELFMVDYRHKEYFDTASLLEDWFLSQLNVWTG